MKNLCLFLFLAISGFASAQVAINTDGSLPNNSAMLDVKSTTKGLLIPSMTSAQRNLIIAPAEGLIVYDLTSDLLYQYQNGTWRTMITNEYWAKNSTDMYNVNLNVGIGNANPTEKLHVTGNIRTTGDLLSSGDINMNNPTGIMQFQNAGVNKGFVQLSGDNLRLGTNSGNATGNLVVRMDGTDRIFVDEAGRMGVGVSNPTSRLHVGGDINVTGSISLSEGGNVTRPVTGSANLLPVCYGRVSYQATSMTGTPNVSVARLSTGVYEITCPQFNSTTTIVVTMNSYQGGSYAYPNVENSPVGSTTYRVSFYIIGYGPGDAGFSFVAYQ